MCSHSIEESMLLRPASTVTLSSTLCCVTSTDGWATLARCVYNIVNAIAGIVQPWPENTALPLRCRSEVLDLMPG